MGRHQIRNQVLFLSRFFRQLVKPLDKAVKRFDMGFPHPVEHRRRAVLRRHLQLPADMVLHQFLEKGLVLVLQQIIEPDAGTDEHPLDPWQRPQAAQ